MQSKKEIEQARKYAGRINMAEYSKLAGKPIPQDAAPSKTKTRPTAQTKNRIKLARKYTGRINAAELDALTKRQGNRKQTAKRMPK